MSQAVETTPQTTSKREAKSAKSRVLPPVDDKLAEKVGMKNIDELKEKIRSSLLEVLNDAQRVKIMVEAEAMTSKTPIQSTLTSMAEWRMADVVHQGKRLGKIFIEA